MFPYLIEIQTVYVFIADSLVYAHFLQNTRCILRGLDLQAQPEKCKIERWVKFDFNALICFSDALSALTEPLLQYLSAAHASNPPHFVSDDTCTLVS